MKRLFSFFVAMMAVFSLSAETIYDWSGNVGTTVLGKGEKTTVSTVKIHSNADQVPAIKFEKSYELENGHYMAIYPAEGGFKAGDVLSMALVFNNADNTKYAQIDLRAANGKTRIFLSDSASTINGRTSPLDPIVQTYTLEADQDSLLIGRYGTTNMFITMLSVARAEAAPTVAMHGNFTGNWGDTENFTVAEGNATASLTLTLAAGNYEFGMRIGGPDQWIANGVSFTRENASAVIEAGSGNLKLAADAAGEYTFTWTYETNTLVISFPEKGDDPTPVEHTYTVAGSSADAFGTAWTPSEAANDMTKLEDGTYKWEKTDLTLAAGAIEFKVAEDHDWAVAYPAQNYVLNIEAAGTYTLTITFNAETKEVTGEATKTGGDTPEPPTPVEHTYTVAGSSEAAFGTAWTPSNEANDMTQLEDGTYKWEKENIELTAGEVKFKVAEDHAWTVAYPASDYVLNIEAAGTYTLTITFNAETKEVTGEATKTGGDTPEPPTPGDHTYTVAGSSDVAFGKTWTPSEAANDMTKLEDGTYKWEKTDLTLAAGAIEFKVAEDHDWAVAYPAQNYVLNIAESGIYTLTITFNAESKEVSAVATKTGDAVVVPTVAMHGNLIDKTWKDSPNFTVAEDNETASLTLTLAADEYEFGMRIGGPGNWTANGVHFTRENNAAEVVTGSGNLKLTADVAGEYTLTWTYATNTLTITFPEKGDTPELPYVALMGEMNNWDGGANPMNPSQDGLTASATVNLEMNDNYGYAIKILVGSIGLSAHGENGSYVINRDMPTVKLDWVDEHSDALWLSMDKAGEYTFTFTYADSTLAVTFPAKGDDPTPVEHTYTVAGSSADAFGTAWTPSEAANDMTKLEDGTYKWEKTDLTLAAGAIEFKVAEDHDWAVAYPAQNYVLNIAESGIYTLTITFNAETKEVNAVAQKTGDAEVIPTVTMHGDFTKPDWKDTENFTVAEGNATASLTLTLAADQYEFGMRIGAGNWTCNGAQFTRENNSAVVEHVEGSANMKLTADVAGDYTFTWTYATNTLTITFPASTGIVETIAAGKAAKVLRNGQIFIIKGDKKYNVVGAVIR